MNLSIFWNLFHFFKKAKRQFFFQPKNEWFFDENGKNSFLSQIWVFLKWTLWIGDFHLPLIGVCRYLLDHNSSKSLIGLRYSHVFDCVLQTFWIFLGSYDPINICKPQSKASENLQSTTFISKNWKWTKNPLWSISKVISTAHYNRNSLCLQCSP